MVPKEFVVNENLTLKFENNESIIYIKGKPFKQCKYLLLNLPLEEATSINEIESIDEASERLNHVLEPSGESSGVKWIPPETEFWGHCSNLQVWYENNYNTKLLHSNLAFPLLKKLSIVGDNIAQKVFKEEIAKRYFNSVDSVQIYLENEGYLKFLSKEEVRGFIKNNDVIDELENDLGLELQISVQNTISYNVIIKDRSIVRLNLSGLNLKEVPKCVQRLEHLETLYLHSNAIKVVPEWIGKLKSLKNLDIEKNKIKQINSSIGDLTSLETLILAQNELTDFPESIGKLVNLKRLSLHSNEISKLPNSIKNLKNLSALNLNKNSLLELPGSIKNLKNLEVLDIRNNPIKELPTSISELLSLKKLYLSNTKIKKENKVLNKLKNSNVEIYI